MARKKSLGNPLLIAAGTQVATQVVTDELSARRQRATEQRQEEKVQQQQDDLAANQIYAQQKGVDLASAHYLRRRRNRIIGYSLLGATVVTVGIIVAVKVYKFSITREA